MKNVLIRRISLIAGMGILVISFMVKNFLAGQKEDPKKVEAKDETPFVSVATIELDSVNTGTIKTGRLIATDKIEVLAEVTGRLRTTARPFRDGMQFKKGQVLLGIDDTDARLNVVAKRSAFLSMLTKLQADLATDYPEDFEKWEDYIEDFKPESSLSELPKVQNQQEKNFLYARNVYDQYYAIKTLESQLSKYTVYAPFTGVVSNANVTPGSLVRAGQKMGDFVSTNTYELKVGVSLDESNELEIGDMVYLKSSNGDRTWQGELVRIGEEIDNQTLNFNAYVKVEGEDLHEGMFLEARIGNGAVAGAAKIQASLISDLNTVYVVSKDSTLKSVKVEVIGEESGDAYVLGLSEGDVLMEQELISARDGMKVRYQIK